MGHVAWCKTEAVLAPTFLICGLPVSLNGTTPPSLMWCLMRPSCMLRSLHSGGVPLHTQGTPARSTYAVASWVSGSTPRSSCTWSTPTVDCTPLTRPLESRHWSGVAAMKCKGHSLARYWTTLKSSAMGASWWATRAHVSGFMSLLWT